MHTVEVCNSIAAAADNIERTRRIPADLLAKLHNARLYRMFLPSSIDGDEVDPATYLRAIETIARSDGSVAWNLFVGNSAALIAPHLPPAAARNIFSPANAIVAWGPPNDSIAELESGGYRISGRWGFASGCRDATWMGLHCRVRGSDGNPCLNAAGHPATRTMLFPVEKATLIDTWDTIGLRGTASDSYSVENLFVPDDYTGTRDDPGSRRNSGPLYAFPMQGLYAIGVAGVALGLASGMLDAFNTLTHNKKSRGSSKLSNDTAIQVGFAKAEAKLGSSRAYASETLGEIYERAKSVLVITTTDQARLRLAASNAIHNAIEVADWVYKQAGIDSIFSDSLLQRRFRDIHTLSQQIQSRDSHFESVGKILLENRSQFSVRRHDHS